MKARDLDRDESFGDIIRRAIADEEDSHAFYCRAAEVMLSGRERQVLLDLAKEELEHRRKLEDILSGWETREALNGALGS